jgi:hypothetical protein
MILSQFVEAAMRPEPTAGHLLKRVGPLSGATKWLKRAILPGRGVLQLPLMTSKGGRDGFDTSSV